MKKNLFLFAIIAGVSFPAAQAGLRVSADTGVKVSKSTLLYVDGNVNMDNYSSGATQKLSNEGYVEITKGFTNENTASDGKNGNNFVNEYKPNSHYGQLIIDNGASVAGQMRGVLNLADNYAYHSIALPFKKYTFSDVNRDAFDGSASVVGYNPNSLGFDKNRYKNPVLFWDNDKHYMAHIGNLEEVKPGLLFSLNTYSKNPILGNIAKTSDNRTFDGVPNFSDVNVSVKKYNITKNDDLNEVGEYYGSYIKDFTKTKPVGWLSFTTKSVEASGYGDNIFWLGNPYTSNIDLNKNASFSLGQNVMAIVQSTANNYNTSEGSNVPTGTMKAYTTQGAGDPVGIIRPFHIFGVKMKDGFETHTFNFTNDMKTFEEKVGTPNIMLARGYNQPVIYQVGMDLYDKNGINTGNRFYVVASEVYQAEAKGATELYNHEFSDNEMGAYTLQETESGEIAQDLSQNKTYINGVNFNYIGKPIHIVFQTKQGSTFTFKPRLNQTLAKSKFSFYFEDKQESVIKKVDENFEYTFNVSGTTKDRFVMYWMETPSNITPEEIDEVEVAQTIVFKDFDQYKVRFDSDWTKADIFVYSISGQLLYSDLGVHTTKDYKLNLKENVNVYIIKVIGDNGQIISKKIIK